MLETAPIPIFMYHSGLLLSPSKHLLFVSRFGRKRLPNALNVNVNVHFSIQSSSMHNMMMTHCVWCGCVSSRHHPILALHSDPRQTDSTASRSSSLSHPWVLFRFIMIEAQRCATMYHTSERQCSDRRKINSLTLLKRGGKFTKSNQKITWCEG